MKPLNILPDQPSKKKPFKAIIGADISHTLANLMKNYFLKVLHPIHAFKLMMKIIDRKREVHICKNMYMK